MNDDELSEFPESPEVRIQVVGVGALGRSVVDRLTERTQPELALIACDQDLRAPSFGATDAGLVRHEVSASSLPQSDAVPWSWLYNDRDRAALVKRLSASDLVFVVTDLASTEDGAATCAIAQLAREANAMSIIIGAPSPGSETQAGFLEAADSVILVSTAAFDSLADGDARKSHPNTQAVATAVLDVANLVAPGGLVNVDMKDLRLGLAGSGLGRFGRGSATGRDAPDFAASQALADAEGDEDGWVKAASVLVNVTANETLTLQEFHEAVSWVQHAVDHDAELVYGIILDASAGDRLYVSVVLTGSGA